MEEEEKKDGAAGENKPAAAATSKKAEPKQKKRIHVDGPINMPIEMITTKEKFEKLWGRKLKGADITPYWERAQAFKKENA